MNALRRVLTRLGPVILAACTSTPLDRPSQTPPGSPAGRTEPSAPVPAASSVPAPSTVVTVTIPPHRDPSHVLSRQRSVFFDYDDFSIKQPYRHVIEAHSKYLLSRPELAIRIEGHSDERGSAEYNLALGQRRAESVLTALQIYGISPSRIEPISYGEERPAVGAHDEAAWAQNRRADIAYLD